MNMTQLEQQNQLLQQQLDVFAEAIRQQKLAMEEADARVAELTDIVNHLSEKQTRIQKRERSAPASPCLRMTLSTAIFE